MIGRILPGLNDSARCAEAYRLLRRSGIAGCLVTVVALLVTQREERPGAATLCLALSFGWVVAMLGASLIVDVRRWVVMAREQGLKPADAPSLVVHGVVALSLLGTGLLAFGTWLDVTLSIAVVSAETGGDGRAGDAHVVNTAQAHHRIEGRTR